VKPGGDPIPLGREHPWRRTIAATAFVLGAVVGAIGAWLLVWLTQPLR